MISQARIDNDYIKVLEGKIASYNKTCSATYEEIVDVDTLMNIGRYINELKPKSKYRDYKYQILKFLEILERDDTLSKKQVVVIVQEHLSDLFILLKSKHSFIGRHDWFWRGVFNVALDVLLISIGIAKYYYYLPIFTAFAIIRNISKLKKAKKEGRYIDF